MLDENRNNFLGCVYAAGGSVGVCFADITTGSVYATGSDNWNDITSEFGRFAPREVLVGGGAISGRRPSVLSEGTSEALIEPMPEECFEAQRSAERIQEHFKVQDFGRCGSD